MQDGTSSQLATAVDKKTRRIDTSYEIYLALYQAITGPEERQKLFRELSPDFFDLIVVDECHRGSAAEDSAWREILDYFSSATQIGLTATPKETEVRLEYPLFRRADLHVLAEARHPRRLPRSVQSDQGPHRQGRRGLPSGEWRSRKFGNEIEDRIYNQKDFDKNLVIDERTQLVAKKVTEFLKESGDRFRRPLSSAWIRSTPPGCGRRSSTKTQSLFARMSRYVMRITGNDR